MFLDNIARPVVNIGHKPVSAFFLCGYAGLTLAVLLAFALTVRLGLSLQIIIMLIAVSVTTFLLLAMATKIITGREQLIYYHHEIAIVLTIAMILWLLDVPVLPYLDVVILGVGTFLICGRIGCFMMGCCHGRPYRFGVCYSEEHAHAGFTPYYVGIRLLPIQLIESAWVLFIVISGIYMIVTGQPPGSVLAWYIISYDVGRFCFEFVRGDPERAYLLGFSEGQWISILLMGVIVVLGQIGVLPMHQWHMDITIGFVIGMVLYATGKHYWKAPANKISNPKHVKEIASLISDANPTGAATPGTTSLGIQISSGVITEKGETLQHYALSSRHGLMTDELAESVARLILQLKQTSAGNELVKGSSGVFHVLINTDNA